MESLRSRFPSPKWLLVYLISVAILFCSVVFQTVSPWQSADDWLVKNRMGFSKQPAQQEIVFLAIDRKTLDGIGVWPWPRSVIAKTIDYLVTSEALEIFLDIDFSARSTSEEDAILAKALQDADGTVILSAFSQGASVNSALGEMVDSLPLPMFQENSWLATVNVIPDDDGIVRRFPYGHVIASELLPSVPAVLSGKMGPPDSYFEINYAIDPATVPTYSLIDVLSGRIPNSTFEHKTVVVGAHAIELRDSLAVPVHGTLSGSMLQIIATETLRQDMELVHVLPIWPLLLCFVLQIGCLLILHHKRLTLRIIGLAAISLCAEAAGFILFLKFSLVLPTAAIHGMNAAIISFMAFREMDIRRYMTMIADARATNATNLLRQVFDDSAEAIVVVDENGDILEASPKSRQVFRISTSKETAVDLPEEVLEKVKNSIANLRAGAQSSSFQGEMQLINGVGDAIIEYTITPSLLKDIDGPTRLKSEDKFVACIMARDITEKRIQAEKLNFLSERDELTGAYRRHAFTEILGEKLSKLPSGRSCQILVLNLNRFKTVNTTLGREVGNQLLRAVVAKLESSELEFECVARLLGDTFAILLKSTSEESLLKAKAEATAKLVEDTYFLDSVSISIGARISYVCSESSIQSPEAMLNCAELALDDSKNSGARTIKGFDSVSTAQHMRARELERDLRPALDEKCLEVYYQPQVDVSGRQLVGVEALARWTHPVLGPISPMEFIAIAEASGTIVQLGQWILRTACLEAASWSVPVKIGVNVSPVQLVRGNIIEDLKAALEESGLPSSRLMLEITESSFLEGDEDIMNTLRNIRALGVSLALDDFGTGYASLGYISRFPIDVIKVDQSFVRTLTTDLASQSIVQFTKRLSEVLGMTMLCEGVETEQQMKFLSDVGCDQAQGYLFGQPQNATDIRRMIDNANRVTPNLKLASSAVA